VVHRLSPRAFEVLVGALVESQGGETFAALALDELGITYIDEVPVSHQEFFLGRCAALWEEST
jgi:hypothetical protein